MSLTSWPPMRMSPEICYPNPAIIRSSVVFPHPLGPSRTRNSPSLVARSTPSTANDSPKRFLMFRVSTIAIGVPPQSGRRPKIGEAPSDQRLPLERQSERRRSDQFLLLPLRPDLLALALGLLDGFFRRHRARACLGEHGIDHPGIEDLIDRRGGIAGIANVGRPVERVGEHLVLARGFAFGVPIEQLVEVRHLIPETGEIVEFAGEEPLPEISDVVDEELLRSLFIRGEFPDHVTVHHVLQPHPADGTLRRLP